MFDDPDGLPSDAGASSSSGAAASAAHGHPVQPSGPATKTAIPEIEDGFSATVEMPTEWPDMPSGDDDAWPHDEDEEWPEWDDEECPPDEGDDGAWPHDEESHAEDEEWPEWEIQPW